MKGNYADLNRIRKTITKHQSIHYLHPLTCGNDPQNHEKLVPQLELGWFRVIACLQGLQLSARHPWIFHQRSHWRFFWMNSSYRKNGTRRCKSMNLKKDLCISCNVKLTHQRVEKLLHLSIGVKQRTVLESGNTPVSDAIFH